MMNINNIHTHQGSVALQKPPIELTRAIRSLLPLGAVRFGTPQRGANFGLVMQAGERELFAVKQQPTDCDVEQAGITFQANSILIAHSLQAYLAHGFAGLFLPCTYLRPKEGGAVEAGIAYFGGPSDQGCEAQAHPVDGAYDGRFGRGFTAMMCSFIRALQRSSAETGIVLSPTVGLEARPQQQLGSLAFGFMVVGPHVVCLKTVASEQDPIWTVLRSQGITEVFHLPSVPACIREEDFKMAKDGA